MHVTVTSTKGTPGQPSADATLVGESMFPWLEQIEGFHGMVVLTDESENRTLVLTFWESREVAERHRPARDEFRDRITSTVDVQLESSADYGLSFAAFCAPLPRLP